jgi:hypothetical protein
MDTKEIIAEMFLKDYQATWDGEAENWSQIVILSDFLLWLDQRRGMSRCEFFYWSLFTRKLRPAPTFGIRL